MIVVESLKKSKQRIWRIGIRIFWRLWCREQVIGLKPDQTILQQAPLVYTQHLLLEINAQGTRNCSFCSNSLFLILRCVNNDWTLRTKFQFRFHCEMFDAPGTDFPRLPTYADTTVFSGSTGCTSVKNWFGNMKQTHLQLFNILCPYDNS